MKHFLEISQLTRLEVNNLLNRAWIFKKEKKFPVLSSHRMANLFYENSTRTRISFELAACNLALPVVNFNLATSSENKGESIEDTLQNLIAMGIDLFIVRHSQDELPKNLASYVNDRAHIINAGDGKHAHPTQAMLDLMTILEQHLDPRELTVAIVGNICHSRVANSLITLLALMEIKDLRLIAPEIWLPPAGHFGRAVPDLREGIADADVIVCLRVQKERLSDNDQFDLAQYRDYYAITNEVLQDAKQGVMIMHPGPINRGVELDSEVADGPRSFILQQVENGVYMRMAIIEAVLQS